MLVKARIQRWRRGDILGLWSLVEASGAQLHLVVEGTKRCTEGGQCQVCQAGSGRRPIQKGHTDFEMGLLQPPLRPFRCWPSIPSLTPTDPPVRISVEEVACALRSFPSCSAPGPSSLGESPDRANSAPRRSCSCHHIVCWPCHS